MDRRVFSLVFRRVEEFLEKIDLNELTNELNDLYGEKVMELEERIEEGPGAIPIYDIRPGDISMIRAELLLKTGVVDTIDTLIKDDHIEPERIVEKLDDIIELRWNAMKELTVYNLIGQYVRVDSEVEQVEESYMNAVRDLFT